MLKWWGHTWLLLALLLTLLLGLLSACATPTPVSLAPRSRMFVLGDISDDPGEVIEGSQPLADYVAEQLQGFGYTAGSVRVASTADEMVALLQDGEVDLYFDSVYPATLICDSSGAQPILRRWRYGVETYHTIIFASEESGITTLDDLPGHLIALDNRFSTSGFLLPVVTLLKHDLMPVGKASYEAAVAEDEVGFVFSYDDENTLQWVLSGYVGAGATDDYHYEVAFPEEARAKLVKLAETESVPRQIVVARPGMPPDLLAVVKRVLITANETEAGQAALEPFQTTRFDEFPEGIEAAQDRMRELMTLVEGVPMP